MGCDQGGGLNSTDGEGIKGADYVESCTMEHKLGRKGSENKTHMAPQVSSKGLQWFLPPTPHFMNRNSNFWLGHRVIIIHFHLLNDYDVSSTVLYMLLLFN